MHSPSLTIETVHGLKETIIFSNFTVGPQTSASPRQEDQYESYREEDVLPKQETADVSMLRR